MLKFLSVTVLSGLSFRSYVRSIRGAIALVFALTAPLVIMTSGMALDYAHAYLVQQRLAQAIDAAALAATAYSTDAGEIEQRVQDFFDINYSEAKLGVTFEPEVVISGNEVTVTGGASYKTFFLDVVGISSIDVVAETTVLREIKGLEVVLVLDNTGSMATNDNIGKLRTASCEFVEILYGTYDSEDDTDCLDRYGSFVDAQNESVKVGLVPYSTSVNVGPYGMGYDDDGDSYDSAFLNNPLELSYSYSEDTDLCVLEEDDGSDVIDHEGPWDMYRWCREDGTDDLICDYSSRRGVYTARNSVDYACPGASVLPLSEDMTALKDRINEMEADGWTYGNVGMVWGWRMISPDYPFTEGVSFDDETWRKVVVMMTDGDNVLSSPYGAYGYSADHSVDSSGDLDDRLEEVCENMAEEDNLIVYTITFEASSGGIDDDTQEIYEGCAGNGGYYSHVTTSDELVDVFREIAQELSNLHIKG